MKTSNKFCAYYRVSIQKQGNSGLGLSAQRETVENFIKHNGNRIVMEFTEVESGRKNDRPELQKAIEYCRLNGCTLVVAKLDRLARNLHFITNLMESKIPFVACDLPEMNDLSIHIFAAMAEFESKLISERTKSALVQARLRGSKLGMPGNLKPEHIAKARIGVKRNARANRNNRMAYHYAKNMRESGKSLREIVSELNKEGYRTRRNCLWTPSGIRNLLIMFGENPGKPH